MNNTSFAQGFNLNGSLSGPSMGLSGRLGTFGQNGPDDFPSLTPQQRMGLMQKEKPVGPQQRLGALPMGTSKSQFLPLQQNATLSPPMPPPPPSSEHLLPSALTNDKHGLLGLIDVLRMSTDPDTNMLSLGCELTSLGLNLNSPTPLYTTMSSVYAPAINPDIDPLLHDPHFTVPPCYRVQMPAVPDLDPAERIAASSEDALFFAFYAFPRDRIQEAAAQELYSRGWRFHKDIKVWLTKEANVVPVAETSLSGSPTSGAGSVSPEKEPAAVAALKSPTAGTPTSTSLAASGASAPTSIEFVAGERGVFVFFDPAHWQRVKKEWIVNLDALEERNPSN
ncbi:hypothetical protein HDU98_010010 [Podochytrium sp. JEL0797]|nr:hypothetical protein HDU98_010010 [Podochytrium sp. JEL0797]